MTPEYRDFVELGQEIAKSNGVDWTIPLDESGRAIDQRGWCLTDFVGARRPVVYLREFRVEKSVHKALDPDTEDKLIERTVLSAEWQDLIKAVTLYQLFRKRSTPAYVGHSLIRPLKVVATVSQSECPSELTIDDARRAIELAKEVQASGKLADLVAGLIRNYFDGRLLTSFAPIYPSLSAKRLDPYSGGRRPEYLRSKTEMLASLEARKGAAKLPETRALWELVRIVFTEKPRSFMDELRFAALKILLLTGMRLGEVIRLPRDCYQEKKHLDRHGRPAGENGGISTSTVLKYYTEKRQTDESDSIVLFENSKDVPPMFADIIKDTVSRISDLTAPLRRTLTAQIDSGRLMPWFDPDELVPIAHLYTYLTGNPTWTDLSEDDVKGWLERCRTGEGFDSYQEHQKEQLLHGKTRISNTIYVYLNRLKSDAEDPNSPLRFLKEDGVPYPVGRMKWESVYVRISELERYLQTQKRTKLSDIRTFKLETGAISTADLLFLQPKRSLAEERNGGVCDTGRYFAVGYCSPEVVALYLGGMKHSAQSIFKNYGSSEDDWELDVDSHQFRHLMNTELFRLGLADTIITKHFGRRSVPQSYEYDHRTHADRLSQIEIPPDVEQKLGPHSSTVLRLINEDRASGPIVDDFKRIQAEEGDDAAFEFLSVEADGFHSTPYGYCLNSFTVDPCPKHLECFEGCRHLAATENQEHTVSLSTMRDQLKKAAEAAKAKPPGSIGRENQIRHAQVRLEGVEKLLKAKPGERPFPGGPDFSKKKVG